MFFGGLDRFTGNFVLLVAFLNSISVLLCLKTEPFRYVVVSLQVDWKFEKAIRICVFFS